VNAWGTFSDPAAPNWLPPSTIMDTPTPWLTSMSSRPRRIAHAKLLGASVLMNERIVTKTVTRRTTPTRIPIQENTVSSNTVSC
jgi:hypothetical protein